MQGIDKQLVQDIFLKYDNWGDRTREYNRITGQERSEGTLRANYSRYKGMGLSKDGMTFNEVTDLILDEKIKPLTEERILKIINLDSKEFQLKEKNTGVINRWWNDSENSEEEFKKRVRNGQIKIYFEKRVEKITLDKIEEVINNCNIEPRKLKRVVTKGSGLLEIPLFDMHFGNMTFEQYEKHQQEIANYVLSREWEQVLFIIGQDLFHNDDFRGRTTGGTLIEKENMDKAWEDVNKFYIPLIELALENSKNVDIIYSRGNHDETLAWAFVKSLKRLYPQAKVCDKQQEHKHFIYHNVFLGYTHGDKISDKKIVRNFEALYRLDMAKAKRRILKKGHIHTLKSFDDNGTHVMTLGTGNDSDQWHTDNGFIGNHKAFEIFIYNEDTLKGHLFIE